MHLTTPRSGMFVFGGAILLSTAGAAESTDLITWDNSCGDNRWLTCCDARKGEDDYMDNNWTLGTWPDYCFDSPGPADDVSVGSGLVILDDAASVNSLSASGVFTLESGSLSVSLGVIHDGAVNWLAGTARYGVHYTNGDLNISSDADKHLVSAILDSSVKTPVDWGLAAREMPGF